MQPQVILTMRRPLLTVSDILSWADDHHSTTGRWPKYTDGPVPGNHSDNWRSIDDALRYGLRGMPGGSSLAQILAEHRDVRNVRSLPPLAEKLILAWSDAFHHRHGAWPTADSGPIVDAPGEVWQNVDMALR